MTVDYDAELRRIARVLLDMAQTLSSLDAADDRLQRALALAGKLIPYRVCAFLERRTPQDERLITVPAQPAAEHERLRQRLVAVLSLVDEDGEAQALADDRAHLTLPIMGLERIIGVIRVEPEPSQVYDVQHVRLLSVIATQLGAYVTTLMLRAEDERRTREMSAAHDFQRLLVGAVSHDLRNPLAVITTVASTLLPKAQDQRQAKALERALRSAQRATRIINDLLDVTHARVAGGMTVSRSQADLAALVGEVVDDVRVAHPARRIELQCRPAEPLDGAWDADRVSQLLTNLIHNALQHGDAAAPIEVELVRDRGRAVLSVRNQGPAIPPALLPEIFDPFRRGGRAARKAGGGLGLGLYIVAQIARAHDGAVEVRSDGTGTCFTVTMPIAPAPAQAAARPAHASALVLVVDDDPDLRAGMSDILEERGLRVVVASNGEEALATLRRGLHPDLALVDLWMPVMDGEAFCNACKDDPALADIPMLIVSADAAAAVKAARLGTLGHLAKPISAESIVQAIEKIATIADPS